MFLYLYMIFVLYKEKRDSLTELYRNFYLSI